MVDLFTLAVLDLIHRELAKVSFCANVFPGWVTLRIFGKVRFRSVGIGSKE